MLSQVPPPVPPAPAPQHRAFKPYGSPPPFDLEAERDSFPIWEERWNIFLALSTIDEALDVALRPTYKTNQLKAVLPADPNAARGSVSRSHRGSVSRPHSHHRRTPHTLQRWSQPPCGRHQFTLLIQLPNQTADNWLCSLRDVSRKCDFGLDCCALCEPTRILGQLIAGVADNAVRIKL